MANLSAMLGVGPLRVWRVPAGIEPRELIDPIAPWVARARDRLQDGCGGLLLPGQAGVPGHPGLVASGLGVAEFNWGLVQTGRTVAREANAVVAVQVEGGGTGPKAEARWTAQLGPLLDGGVEVLVLRTCAADELEAALFVLESLGSRLTVIHHAAPNAADAARAWAVIAMGEVLAASVRLPDGSSAAPAAWPSDVWPAGCAADEHAARVLELDGVRWVEVA